MARNVNVRSEELRYVQEISIGGHVIKADEPTDAGGNDTGPNPYELLLAALGACTSMTLQMYAERKRWPLQEVRVNLSHAKIHARDCTECDPASLVDQIEMEVSLFGNLSQEQRVRLMEIANKCPVHRTLTSPIQIRTHLT